MNTEDFASTPDERAALPLIRAAVCVQTIFDTESDDAAADRAMEMLRDNNPEILRTVHALLDQISALYRADEIGPLN